MPWSVAAMMVPYIVAGEQAKRALEPAHPPFCENCGAAEEPVRCSYCLTPSRMFRTAFALDSKPKVP